MTLSTAFVNNLRRWLADWYTPDEAERWLNSPQPLLDGKKPIDARPDEVLRLLDQLESGSYT